MGTLRVRIAMARLSFIDEGHRAVVFERHDHHLAKSSGLHRNSGGAQLGDEELEHRSRLLRLLGIVEARTAAALDRSGQRELLDRENRSADVSKIAVHPPRLRSEEHTSELQSRGHLVCRLLLEKKK